MNIKQNKKIVITNNNKIKELIIKIKITYKPLTYVIYIAGFLFSRPY